MPVTSREREICDLLRQEPLISQEELATRLGITRSSVAVHISNLIKKGIIIGKGYVFSQQAICTVVGKAAYLTLVQAGEPDQIERRPEGLAIKGCQSLKNFGLSAKVFTVLGTDAEGDELLALLAQCADVNGVERPTASKSRQLVRVNRAGSVETYDNMPDDRELLKRLDKNRFPWLDCHYLWVEPDHVTDILPMIKESSLEPPLLVACSYDTFTGMDKVDVWIKGDRSGQEPQIPPGDKTVVVTDGRHYVMARQGAEEIRIDILPGQQFDVENDLERFAAGFIYGLSRGNQLRQALRMAIGNTVYQTP